MAWHRHHVDFKGSSSRILQLKWLSLQCNKSISSTMPKIQSFHLLPAEQNLWKSMMGVTTPESPASVATLPELRKGKGKSCLVDIILENMHTTAGSLGPWAVGRSNRQKNRRWEIPDSFFSSKFILAEMSQRRPNNRQMQNYVSIQTVLNQMFIDVSYCHFSATDVQK